MSDFIVNEQYLDNEIITLLVKEGFSVGDIGALCYKEVIKNAIYKLIEYEKSEEGATQHGSLLSSMCILNSEFYKEVYDIIISKKLFNISSIGDLHILIKEALPKDSLDFNHETYMMKANALAYSIKGKLEKQNGIIRINENKTNDGIDDKIMNILETYGFDKNNLGAFCYKEVIKEAIREIIICMHSNIDNSFAIGEILKDDTNRLYSHFYINVWSIVASSRKIKKLELEHSNKGFEFNFAYMHKIIKECLYNSDLALKLNDSNYSEVLANNINEIATMVIEELQNGKLNGFGKIKKIDSDI